MFTKISENATVNDFKNDEIVSTIDIVDGNKDRDSIAADDNVSKIWNLVKKMKHANKLNPCNNNSIDGKGSNNKQEKN